MSNPSNSLLEQLAGHAHYTDKLKQQELQQQQWPLSSSLLSTANSFLPPSSTTIPSDRANSLLSCYMQSRHTAAATAAAAANQHLQGSYVNKQLQDALANHQRSAAALSSAVAAAERASSLRRLYGPTSAAAALLASSAAAATTTGTTRPFGTAATTATPGLADALRFLPRISTTATSRSASIYDALESAIALEDSERLSSESSTTRAAAVATTSVMPRAPLPERASIAEQMISIKDNNTTSSKEQQQQNNDMMLLRPTVVRDDYWDSLYGRLVAYKKKHGDCLVPSRYADDRQLGRWVSRQRERQNYLSKECKDLLNSIGFTWNVFQRKSWESMFDRLVQYKMEHGNCLVPARNKSDPRLGRWVRKQRMVQSNISEERRKRLDSIGFVWNVR